MTGRRARRGGAGHHQGAARQSNFNVQSANESCHVTEDKELSRGWGVGAGAALQAPRRTAVGAVGALQRQ